MAQKLAKYVVMNCINDSWHDTPPAYIRDTLLLEQSALVV
jgi:hypothetical protein